MKIRIIYQALAFLIVPALLFLSGCARKDAADKKDDIVAYVNKEPVFESDLQRDIDLRAKQDPSFKLTPESKAEQLDIIIDKKIITQDAMRRGLARQDKFVNTIKSFWEQTLIRDFIELKKEEFGKDLIVTEDDVDAYYAKLLDRVTFKALKSKDKKYIQDAKAEFERNKDSAIIPWQVIGPAGYDELAPGALMDAFDMPVGEARVFEIGPDYFLIYMAARDKRSMEPIEDIRPELEERVRELKERLMFEEWLVKEREKSDIKLQGK